MRLVCISDTHGQYDAVTVPRGDVLIHAGDITNLGDLSEFVDFNKWVEAQPHKHKIVIAGNHDRFLFEALGQGQKILTNATYLEDSGVVIDGIKFYGCPWTPLFNNWYFMLPRGSNKLRAKWAAIPKDTDVLITHGPCAGKLDFSEGGNYHGCDYLRDTIGKVKPRYHIFGHNHSEYGFAFNEHTVFANVSTCDEKYEPINSPVVLDIDP